MRKTLQKILAAISRRILHKYKPRIIGVTGSHGKTSAKEAIYAALAGKFTVQRSLKNYNNEFGVPLAIIGRPAPGRNIFKWLGLIGRGLWMAYAYVSYPQVLILEMGVDRVGDMDYLVSIAKPDIGVLTSIGLSHLEFFGTQEKILEEKTKIFRNIGRMGYAIMNIDDPMIKSHVHKVAGKIITYGFDISSDVRILDYNITYARSQHNFGTMFRLQNKHVIQPMFLSGTVGLPHIMACAAAAAVGVAMGLTLHEVSSYVENYVSEPGRLRLIPGIKHSTIIDDTYNASPASVAAALHELHEFPAAHKIAVLGDMLELGRASERAHIDVANLLAGYSFDHIVGVGPLMKKAMDHLHGAVHHVHASKIKYFEKSTDAIEYLKEVMQDNSAVLVKGSQGIRMEKIVKGIMAEPEKAEELLCRQEKRWMRM